jgi:hypothetical protein
VENLIRGEILPMIGVYILTVCLREDFEPSDSRGANFVRIDFLCSKPIYLRRLASRSRSANSS